MDLIHNFDELRAKAVEITRSQGLVKVVLAPADDPESLYALKNATDLKLVEPVLAGDPARIAKIAAQTKVDISTCRIIPATSNEDAVIQASHLVQSGEADLLMRGNLKAREFLKSITQETTGLWREGQFWSHVGIFWPQSLGRFLLVSDAYVNADPPVDTIPRIIANAVVVARALGLERARVALLTGVEVVDSRPAAMEGAAVITRLAAQGEVLDAVVDGPMPFDAAVDEEAACRKNCLGEVAGRADIAIVNNTTVGHALYKAILMHGPVRSAGLLMGAGRPVIFCSRNEASEARVNAIALAVVMRGLIPSKIINSIRRTSQ